MDIERRSMMALPFLAAAMGAAGTATNACAAPAPAQLSAKLAAFAVNTRYEALSARTREITKRSLLDGLGVSLAATTLEPICNAFSEQALAEGGAPKSLIWAAGVKTSPANAAMANGALAHALDYEDVHDASGMHPNAAAIPALLAVAEAEGGISGKDFITALAVGCDLAARLGLAREENLNKYGWYFPPIAGAFGATAAVGRLLQLTETQMIDALSLTLCQTSCSAEIVNAPDSHIRAIRDSFAAQTAVRSAYLAKRGVRGFDQPFEGPAGFITMYARGRYKTDALLVGLGEKFHGDDISFKAWPSCRGSHQYIQASLDIRAKDRVRADQIESVATKVSALDQMLCEPAASKRAPQTSIDAKFSIPFTIAASFVHGDITLNSFDEKARADAAVLKLASRVTYTVDEAAAKSGTAPIVAVRTRDGKSRTRSIGHLLGSPELPMTDKALLTKFVDCCGYAPKPASEAALGRFADQIMAMETLADVTSVSMPISA